MTSPPCCVGTIPSTVTATERNPKGKQNQRNPSGRGAETHGNTALAPLPPTKFFTLTNQSFSGTGEPPTVHHDIPRVPGHVDLTSFHSFLPWQAGLHMGIIVRDATWTKLDGCGHTSAWCTGPTL